MELWMHLVPWLQVMAEIAILFIIIYGVLYYLRGTRGSLVLFGIFFLWLMMSQLARIFSLTAISHLFEVIGGSIVVILFVIFQPELRRVLAQIGSYAIWQGKRRREMIGELTAAVASMSRRKCGALIVVERRMHLQVLIDDAILLDDKVTAGILESIFYTGAPLHDGAVVIRGERIVAARAILPLTRSKDVPAQLGTRHRAALGISEESDAVTIVVSEETGTISITHRGVLHRDLTSDDLAELLEKLLVFKDEEEFTETAMLLNEDNVQEDAGAEETGVEAAETEVKK